MLQRFIRGVRDGDFFLKMFFLFFFGIGCASRVHGFEDLFCFNRPDMTAFISFSVFFPEVQVIEKKANFLGVLIFRRITDPREIRKRGIGFLRRFFLHG